MWSRKFLLVCMVAGLLLTGCYYPYSYGSHHGVYPSYDGHYGYPHAYGYHGHHGYSWPYWYHGYFGHHYSH